MSDDLHLTRRRLINASGATALSSVVPVGVSAAEAAPPTQASSRSTKRATLDRDAVSPLTSALADYVARTLDREMPEDVVAATKLHVLDTLAAMVAGSRLKPGDLAARYVESLGGTPEATVIGSKVLTSPVNAALANAMAAHADETDDTDPVGPVHLGCGAVPAALATAEMADRTGQDMLRAVTLGYDIGARIVLALGLGGSRRFSSSCLATTFVSAATAAAMLRLDPRQVRHTFSYAAQQASGLGFWERDREHIEKAFDFGGMGARNGVMAATMVAFGFTAVEDPFSGDQNVFETLAVKPAPEKLVAGLGQTHAVFDTTIKKWSVGEPLQTVLDSVATLLENPAVRADNIKRIVAEVPTDSLRIVDNSTIPDLCLQHLVALMIVDRGVTFASVHEVARMSDPKVLAIRKLVDLKPSEALQRAIPKRQAILTIETRDGRSFSHHAIVVRGAAGNPMSAKEVEAKAFDLMTPVIGLERAHELIAAVQGLDRLGPVSGLRKLLQA